jgi:hypothetical protein
VSGRLDVTDPPSPLQQDRGRLRARVGHRHRKGRHLRPGAGGAPRHPRVLEQGALRPSLPRAYGSSRNIWTGIQAVSQDVAESTRIIYGGSVTAKNSKELGTRLHLPLPLHDPSHIHRHISDAAGRRRLPRRRRIAQARVCRHYQLEEGGLGPPRDCCCEQGRQDERRVFP